MDAFINGKRYRDIEYLGVDDLKKLLVLSEKQVKNYADICQNYGPDRLVSTTPLLDALKATRDSVATLIQKSITAREHHHGD